MSDSGLNENLEQQPSTPRAPVVQGDDTETERVKLSQLLAAESEDTQQSAEVVGATLFAQVKSNQIDLDEWSEFMGSREDLADVLAAVGCELAKEIDRVRAVDVSSDEALGVHSLVCRSAIAAGELGDDCAFPDEFADILEVLANKTDPISATLISESQSLEFALDTNSQHIELVFGRMKFDNTEDADDAMALSCGGSNADVLDDITARDDGYYSVSAILIALDKAQTTVRGAMKTFDALIDRLEAVDPAETQALLEGIFAHFEGRGGMTADEKKNIEQRYLQGGPYVDMLSDLDRIPTIE